MSGERLSNADLDRIQFALDHDTVLADPYADLAAAVAEVRRLSDVIDMAQGKRPGWAVVRVPQDIADALHARIASLLTVEEVFARIHGERAAEAEQRWAEGKPAPLDTGRVAFPPPGSTWVDPDGRSWLVGHPAVLVTDLSTSESQWASAAAIIRNEEKTDV